MHALRVGQAHQKKQELVALDQREARSSTIDLAERGKKIFCRVFRTHTRDYKVLNLTWFLCDVVQWRNII